MVDWKFYLQRFQLAAVSSHPVNRHNPNRGHTHTHRRLGLTGRYVPILVAGATGHGSLNGATKPISTLLDTEFFVKDGYTLKFFENNSSRLPKWCNDRDTVKLPFCQI
ncbi:hypothetical protein RJ641_034593 [Dillenia turbinata]|uniref:Uncharacterized protein n=1 Tax=Dillenia turbinata TaxID=194707 RepID=A0AAN8VUQ7_9MAGN